MSGKRRGRVEMFYCVVCERLVDARVGCKTVSDFSGGWCCIYHTQDEIDKAILKMSEEERQHEYS